MRCENCKYWEQINDSHIGDCSFLSGKRKERGKLIYPISEKTGIEGYPICEHDGPAFNYETKEWFGCINFELLV